MSHDFTEHHSSGFYMTSEPECPKTLILRPISHLSQTEDNGGAIKRSLSSVGTGVCYKFFLWDFEKQHKFPELVKNFLKISMISDNSSILRQRTTGITFRILSTFSSVQGFLEHQEER